MIEKILGFVLFIFCLFLVFNLFSNKSKELSSAEIKEAYAIIEQTENQDLKSLMDTATSLVGFTEYKWGGKSSAGGTPERLDCSGYVDWVYKTALNKKDLSIGGTAQQFYVGKKIDSESLKIGDLGFWKKPEDVQNTPLSANHVGIYIGELQNGKHVFIHCSSDKGVNISEFPFSYFRRIV